MRPAVLGLVADDLTGAGDAAAGFAEVGWRVFLSLGAPSLPGGPAPAPSVLAVDAGTRTQGHEDAAARTAEHVAALIAAGAERLYVKIDSTVRGSVAGQVEGALRGWSRRAVGARAVVCPAFPAQLRTVVDGEVLVEGRPLAGSAVARDPVTPRTDGALLGLLPGAVRGRADLAGEPGSQLVVDARDDGDLDRLARVVDAAGPELVVVGSGGLAAALGRVWSNGRRAGRRPLAAGPVLVVVSSLHPTAAEQLAWLRSAATLTDVDVLTPATEPDRPEVAAAELARRTADALARHRHRAVVVVGGDGAAAVLARLGARSVEIDGTVLPGCPTGVVVGGAADGLRLVTKSGGFGAADALHRIVDTLRATPTSPAAADPGPPDGTPPTPEEAR